MLLSPCQKKESSANLNTVKSCHYRSSRGGGGGGSNLFPLINSCHPHLLVLTTYRNPTWQIGAPDHNSFSFRYSRVLTLTYPPMTIGGGSIPTPKMRGSGIGSLPSPPPSQKLLPPPTSSQESPPYSTVVEGLSGAQGTISVISALQAGFLYAGLSSVQLDDFDGASHYLSYR